MGTPLLGRLRATARGFVMNPDEGILCVGYLITKLLKKQHLQPRMMKPDKKREDGYVKKS